MSTKCNVNHVKVADYYEFTMGATLFFKGLHDQWACFDVFFREDNRARVEQKGYSINAGLCEIIDFVKNFSFSEMEIDCLRKCGDFDEKYLKYLSDLKFTGNISAIPDGTPIFPNEPIITVFAPVVEAMLIETDILNRFNHASSIATKAKRIVNSAAGRPVMEFGARRAQGVTAAKYGAKYAYMAGCSGTSCFATGLEFGIPLLGTMAHSLVTNADSEYDAFLGYAKQFPDNTVLLVDTYNTLKSGIPNAIRVAKEYLEPMGKRLKGIRLDSGDLAYLSKEARKMLEVELKEKL